MLSILAVWPKPMPALRKREVWLGRAKAGRTAQAPSEDSCGAGLSPKAGTLSSPSQWGLEPRKAVEAASGVFCTLDVAIGSV
jgi:hypothetical protein